MRRSGAPERAVSMSCSARKIHQYPPSLISYVFPQPGTSIMSSMCHSYLPIAKQTHMAPTTRGHLLTLLKGKKSMRLKGSLIIAEWEGQEPSNTSSNGKDT